MAKTISIDGKNFKRNSPAAKEAAAAGGTIGEKVDETLRSSPMANGNSSITSENLATTSGFKITPPKPTMGATGLGASLEERTRAFNEDLTAKRKERESAKEDALDAYVANQFTPGKEEQTANQYRNDGVDTAESELKDINQQIVEEQVSRRRKLEALDKNPQGLFGGALTAEKQRIETDSVRKEADLTVIQLGRQGKFDLAKKYADQAVAVQLERDKARNEALKINYEDNRSLFTQAEQREFESNQKEREREYDAQEAALKAKNDFALEYLKLDPAANSSTALQMLNSGSLAEAAALAGANVSGFVGASAEDKAYAAQYAMTGQIPTGVKGPQFGRIAALAKEMPKQPGTIVDAQTGVKSATVGQAEQSDFGALANIIKNMEKLKELNKQRTQGVSGALLNATVGNLSANLFGTKNIEEEYLTIRKAIVDDIARMQTGAALTEDEQIFYNDYMPGTFSQAFFIGKNSQQQLDNFVTVLDTRFTERMASYGLAAYGFTKVQGPDGQTYKVGEKITSPDGVTGTVLPDGSISVPDDAGPTSYDESGGGESVSVSIPAGTLAHANNNPGNLRFAGQPGAVQGKGGFARFENPEAGAAALKRQIGLDASRGLTLQAFINKYAPPSENDTGLYIQQVSKMTGISPNAKITKADIDKLARAVAKKESSSTIS